jgi:FkbM family methyltransferase
MKGKKLAAILKSPYYRTRMLRHQVAAGVEHARVLSGLDCRTVVDVGANRGQFALVARQCLPQARLISFEPLPAAAAKFRAVFARDDRVTLHEIAIGPVPGNATIHVSRQDDSSSMLSITSAQVALFPGTAEVATATVRLAPLREFIPAAVIHSPALLKLDVQGFELEALRGCEDLLDRFCYVYAECSFVELYAGQAMADEVIAWLRERGFKLCGVHNVEYDSDGSAIQGDFLFARNYLPPPYNSDFRQI